MDGTELAHYQLLEEIGAGGAGRVYKALDRRLNRLVAVKTLRDPERAAGGANAELLAEARRLAAVRDPRLPAVYAVEEAAGGVFLVMEFVAGETVARLLEREMPNLDTGLDIAAQAAEALEALHANGWVHGDLSSANVVRTPDGNVKLLDFGLARRIAQQAYSGGREPSRDGQPTGTAGSVPAGAAGLTGTPAAMAPELVRGCPPDERTDVFALGALLYELVSGRKPFAGETAAAVLDAVLRREAPPLSAARPGAPIGLERIVRKALEKDPDRRYPSAREFRQDIERLRGRWPAPGEPAPPPSAAKRAEGTGRADFPGDVRRALGEAAAAAGLAALAALALFGQGWTWAAGLFLAGAALGSAAWWRYRRRASRLPPVSPATGAFRGLLPYQPADRDCFFGRERESRELQAMIAAPDCRFAVLLGESGCGKTSLLLAGLVPGLRQDGWFPVYCRSHREPLAGILAECRRQSGEEPRPGEGPLDYLNRLSEALNADIVLICDQFEEFFAREGGGHEDDGFLPLVSGIACGDARRVRMLLSIRSDCLYLLSGGFDGRVPEPLRSSGLYHLRNLDELQAEEVIRRSAAAAGLPLEAGFSRLLARDLAADGRVLPSELQIVGEQLQARRIFTERDYRRAGGRESLVNGHLEEIIRLTGAPAAAGMILRSLIGDDNSRLALPLGEIVSRTQESWETVARVLDLFVQARLVRESPEGAAWTYELIHEYLIGKINALTGRVMNDRQRANRMFHQYWSNYQTDARTRIPLSKLWFIHRHADVRGGERERQFRNRSLRAGLAKLAGLLLLLGTVVAIGVAALSVREEWLTVRLRDGHTAAVRQAAFSPDGRLVVSAGEDNKVIVWDFAGRRRLATFTDHAGWVTALSFSPDGRYFATTDQAGVGHVWDARRLARVRTFRFSTAATGGLGFSPDGRHLLVANHGGLETAAVYSTGDWRFERTIPFWYGVSYRNLVFTPGESLAVDGKGRAWDLETGRARWQLSVEMNDWNWAAISPDGATLLNLNTYGEVSFWDIASQRRLTSRRVHQDHGRAAAWSPDGRWAATGAENIVLWEAEGRTKQARLDYPAVVWSLGFSPDGRYLVSGHADGSVLLWDVAERERVASFSEHSGPVRSVAVTADGRTLASAGEDRSVILWNLARGVITGVLTEHRTRVTGVALSPDGSWGASCDQGGTIILWDLLLGRPRRILPNPSIPPGPCYCVAISPDGRWLASSRFVTDSDGQPQLVLNEGDVYRGHLYGASFSADSRLLALACYQGFVLLFATETWRQEAELFRPGRNFITVSLSPDGRRLATGDDQGEIWLWATGPLRETALLGRHAARVKAVTFSPDGERVASAGDDGAICLWDATRRELVTRIDTHTAPVLALAFTPDGRLLVSGEQDHSVRLHRWSRSLWGFRLP